MTISSPRPVHRERRAAEEEESDPALVLRVAAGDLTALGCLYDRHHHAIHRFARRATGSTADAEDVCHETFLALARIAERYDGRPSARPFLIGVASKIMLARRRSTARFGQVLRSLAAALSEHHTPSPEGVASATEELLRCEHALLQLSPGKRMVVLMVDAEGLTGEEVAETLEIPVGTVWTRLHYGRAELRHALGLQT